MKKMKKRRELDALVNGKTSSSHRKKTKGQHELLRDNSESSDVEEFSIPEQAIVRKRATSRACATCLMGCGLFLLMACLVAVVGLVWVHVELKRTVDVLQTSLRSLEADNGNLPEQFQSIDSKQKEMEAKQKELLIKASTLSDLQKNVTKAFIQIQNLSAQTAQLEKSLSANPQVTQIPKAITALQETAAKGKSNIQALRTDVEDLKKEEAAVKTNIEELENKIRAISAAATSSLDESIGNEKTSQELSSAMNSYFQQQLAQHSSSLSLLNTTIVDGLTSIHQKQKAQSVNFEELNNHTILLDQRLSLLEVGVASFQPNLTGPMMQTVVKQAVTSAMRDLQNISNTESSLSSSDILATVHDLLKVRDDNLTQLANHQKLVINDVSLLQKSVSSMSATVSSNEQRLTTIELAMDHHEGEEGEVLPPGEGEIPNQHTANESNTNPGSKNVTNSPHSETTGQTVGKITKASAEETKGEAGTSPILSQEDQSTLPIKTTQSTTLAAETQKRRSVKESMKQQIEEIFADGD